MKRWKCQVCGQVFEGEQPPVPCPVCGAGEDAFILLDGPKSGKWRCLVCGQVFEGEEPPVPCPVCGAGRDAFEPAAGEEAPPFRLDTQEKFVIIGAGAAGFECAKALRQRNHTASITLIGQEDPMPYNRPALSDVIADGYSLPNVLLESYDFFEANQISLITGETVAAVDLERKTVQTQSGETYAYDKLCVATGAAPFNPIKRPDNGVPVKTLRTFEDAQEIIRLAQGKNVLVVGGGILGLEAAAALRERGCKVTVVELADRILALQADAAGSQAVREGFEQLGISVHTGKTVKDVTESGAVLTDGTVLEADMILVSIGVRSNLGLIQAMGLQCGRGVIVNEWMETSQKDVYACGDCAEFSGRVPGLWPVAVSQGQAAGAAMAGDRESPYTPPIASLVFEYAGIHLFSAGNVKDETETRLTLHDRKNYKLLYFQQGKLCGTLFLGDLKGVGRALALLEKGAGLSEAAGLLA